MTAILPKSPGLFSVFWPISTITDFGWSPLVFLYPNPLVLFTNPLLTVPLTNDITGEFMSHSFFSSLKRSRYLWFFSFSSHFTQWLVRAAMSIILQVLFFVDYYKVWSSGWDLVNHLYLKIPEKFVRLILKDRFRVVRLPFVRMVKFIFLSFPSWSPYPPSHVKSFNLSVLVCCILLICDWSFRLYHHITYISGFLRLIHSCVDMVGFYGVVLLLLAEIQFLSKSFPFLFTSAFFSVRDDACPSLKTSIKLFFFPFFSGYVHCVDPRVLSIVSSVSDQSSSTLFYVVIASFHRWVNAVFNAGKSFSSLFSWHVCQCHLWMQGLMHGH